jgi:hypothetical protein
MQSQACINSCRTTNLKPHSKGKGVNIPQGKEHTHKAKAKVGMLWAYPQGKKGVSIPTRQEGCEHTHKARVCCEHTDKAAVGTPTGYQHQQLTFASTSSCPAILACSSVTSEWMCTGMDTFSNPSAVWGVNMPTIDPHLSSWDWQRAHSG